MRKGFALAVIFLLLHKFSFAQQIVEGIITNRPKVEYQNNNYIIDKVIVTDYETIVVIEAQLSRFDTPAIFSSATILAPSEIGIIDLDLTTVEDIERQLDVSDKTKYDNKYRRMARIRKNWIFNQTAKLSSAGYLIRSLASGQLDTKYGVDSKNKQICHFHLHFDKLPEGIENVYLRELINGGKFWKGIKIRNPKQIDNNNN